MEKPTVGRPFAHPEMVNRALKHFKSLAILETLDRADTHATPEQFASAAKITARVLSRARDRSR
jgi:hypothetical protein